MASKLHVVLDMDDTLIDQYMNPRPFLYDLFKYCFEHCDSLSIWTAATEKWYANVFLHTFQPILDKLSTILDRNCTFLYVYTRKRCTIKLIDTGERFIPFYTKPLHKIWRKQNEISKDNIVIVDDDIRNFYCNYGNGIYISKWSGKSSDFELYDLIQYLKFLKNRNQSIRTIDKRNWKNEIPY